MIEILRKSNCCGCNACVNVCPKKCISMKIDKEGFMYPEVKKDICIECNLCNSVCPMNNEIKKEKVKLEVYACQNKNDQIRKSSSSGGIFGLICKYVIENNGVVIGAAFDNKFNVKHMYAESVDECEKFMGSKYVQSDIGDIYINAKKFLESGRLVLFSGTQCQVKAFNLYLKNKQYDNLITCDVICHGVPSPLVFQKYKELLEEKNESKITEINFRDKRKGWNNFSFTAKFKNKKIYSKCLHQDIYMRGFLSNLYLRPSCYTCKSKNFSSGSDISLADYWGIEGIDSNFNDDMGTSLILLNSSKAKKLFNIISNKIFFRKSSLEDSIIRNPCIIDSVNMNKKRNLFFKVINKYPLDYSINKCLSKSILDKLKSKIKKVLKLILKG